VSRARAAARGDRAASRTSIGGGGGDVTVAIDSTSGSKTFTKVYVTWYGFNDNSCQIETQHHCNTIAFPKSDGFPVAHQIATEGKGTYADPSTFATAARDSGAPAELAPGTRIYVPEVRKYFIMEDQCYECGKEWFGSRRSYHVDLWMGPSCGSDSSALTDCEDTLTLGAAYHGTGTIIANRRPISPSTRRRYSATTAAPRAPTDQRFTVAE
jgi:hypothetical protein